MKKISTVLIIIGVLIMAYPIASNLYTTYWEERLIEEYNEEEIVVALEEEIAEAAPVLEEVVAQEIVYDYDKLQGFFEEQTEVEEEFVDIEAPEPDALIGKIMIPKIDLEMAILEGATNANMKKGGGHMIGTNEIGEIGNAAIAAHRSYTYGRFFNRLNEIEIGDTFTIETDYGKFFYQVYHIRVVEPTDLSVLNRNDTDKVVTLITCTPIRVASHRLIIHAVQVN